MCLHLTGTGYVARTNVNVIIEDFALGLWVAALTIVFVLAAAFRSLRLGLLSVIPSAFPLAVAGSVLAGLGLELQVSSVLAFTVCLGIAVDDTIHLVSRYRAERCAGAPEEAAVRAVTAVGRALVITTLVLVGGWGMLLLSEVPTTQLFGVIGLVEPHGRAGGRPDPAAGDAGRVRPRPALRGYCPIVNWRALVRPTEGVACTFRYQNCRWTVSPTTSDGSVPEAITWLKSMLSEPEQSGRPFWPPVVSTAPRRRVPTHSVPPKNGSCALESDHTGMPKVWLRTSEALTRSPNPEPAEAEPCQLSDGSHPPSGSGRAMQVTPVVPGSRASKKIGLV